MDQIWIQKITLAGFDYAVPLNQYRGGNTGNQTVGRWVRSTIEEKLHYKAGKPKLKNVELLLNKLDLQKDVIKAVSIMKSSHDPSVMSELRQTTRQLPPGKDQTKT